MASLLEQPTYHLLNEMVVLRCTIDVLLLYEDAYSQY